MRPVSSGYRPPSTEPRGKWARAIHRKRRADGLSQQAAFEVLAERLGFSLKSRAAYVALDMGTRQPTEAEAIVLADWLGGYPDDEPMAASGHDTPDVAALLARVDSLVGLVEKLVAQNARLMDDWTPPEDPIVARATDALREAEEAAARERPQSTSRRRRSDPEHRDEAERQVSREGETA